MTDPPAQAHARGQLVRVRGTTCEKMIADTLGLRAGEAFRSVPERGDALTSCDLFDAMASSVRVGGGGGEVRAPSRHHTRRRDRHVPPTRVTRAADASDTWRRRV